MLILLNCREGDICGTTLLLIGLWLGIIENLLRFNLLLPYVMNSWFSNVRNLSCFVSRSQQSYWLNVTLHTCSTTVSVQFHLLSLELNKRLFYWFRCRVELTRETTILFKNFFGLFDLTFFLRRSSRGLVKIHQVSKSGLLLSFNLKFWLSNGKTVLGRDNTSRPYKIISG